MKKTTTLAWLGAAAMLLASAVPAQAANYTLTATACTPTANTTVEAADLTVVTITFDMELQKYTYTSKPFDKCTLKVGNVTIKAVGYTMNGGKYKYDGGTTTGLTSKDNLPAKTLSLLFDQASTLPAGKCTLTIGAGAIAPGASSFNKNNEFTCEWTIGSPDPFASATSTLDPAAGERTSLQDFTVTYSGLTGAINGVGNAGAVTLSNGEGTTKEATGITYTDNSFTVSFDEITTPGQWTLNIPEGTALIDDAKSPAISPVTYTIPKPANPFAVYVITPEAREAYSLSQFEVAFPEFSGTPTIDSTKKATLNGVESTSIAFNEGKVVITFPVVTAAGSYTLSIPAGTISDGTNANELIETTYTILNPLADYQITPQSGSTNSSLKEFVVSYPSFTGSLIVKGVQNAATLNGVSSTSIAVNADGKSFTVTFPEVTKAGTYSLEIPDATVSDGVNESTLIDGTYTIADPFANPTITPADGKHLNTILEVSVTFENAFPESTTLGGANTVTLTDGDGISVNAVRVIEYEDRTGYDVIFDQISNDGTYTVNIPAGFLRYADNESAPLQATYTIQKPTGVFANFTSDPAAGNWIPTTTWGYIKVYFPEISSNQYDLSKIQISSTPSVFSGIGTTSDLDVNYSLYPQKDTAKDYLGLSYMYYNLGIDLNKLDGFYELTIPAGTIKLEDGTPSPEIIIPYTMGNIATGIESVEDAENTVNVYDLTGRQLLKDADASELRTLANGLYIVNGKKVLLRR